MKKGDKRKKKDGQDKKRAPKPESLMRSYLRGTLLFVYRAFGTYLATRPTDLNIKIGEYYLSRFALGNSDFIDGETLHGGQGKLRTSYLRHIFLDEDLETFFKLLRKLGLVATSSTVKEKSSIPMPETKNDHARFLKTPPKNKEYEVIQYNLGKEARTLSYCEADGNCMFRALATLVHADESKHPYLRRSIVHFIHNYKDYFHPYVEEGDVEKHLENMKKDGYWGSEAELYALATILKANIYVYTPNASTYRWILLEPLFECDTLVTGFEQTQVCKYLTVCFTNGNHYDSVLPVKDCNCCLAPPRLEGKEASSTLSKGQNVMDALPQCSCNLKALDSREEPFSCQFKSTFKNEAEDLPSSKRSSEGCSVAPPIPVHSLRVEDQAKRSFSDVLFDDIKSFKRTIYNKDCQENELKKEINQWKDRSDWFEAQLDNEQQKAKDKKDRLHKTYVSMSCCSCTHHLDSIERRPYLLDCGHVACGVCSEKSVQEALLCRTCGQICHAQSEKVFEILLNTIMWIEKELLD
ncbi:uncharacterized protein LOC129923724 [Biomphalaria glabrata]|uniref:Uncharacterized protein LOC129923724 n=1 Tax=Biomphalaria glabrata TaxID=6526 RepID=A0A9W2ZB19_BIOGL|nr:uncharacterized protein LOC129923724 [Biomphalaria glabrata]